MISLNNQIFTLLSPSLVLPLTATVTLAGLVYPWEDSSESILDEGEEADNQLQQTHQSSPQGASHTTSWGQGDATLGGRRREALLPAGTGKSIVPRRIQPQIHVAEVVELALSYLLIHCISIVLVGSLEQAVLPLLYIYDNVSRLRTQAARRKHRCPLAFTMLSPCVLWQHIRHYYIYTILLHLFLSIISSILQGMLGPPCYDCFTACNTVQVIEKLQAGKAQELR